MAELGPKFETAWLPFLCSSPKIKTSFTAALSLCMCKAVNFPVRGPSLDASLSALAVLTSKRNTAETIGALPLCCSPHPGVSYSWGRRAFQSQTQTPESSLSIGLSLSPGQSGADWKCRIHVHKSHSQARRTRVGSWWNNHDDVLPPGEYPEGMSPSWSQQ